MAFQQFPFTIQGVLFQAQPYDDGNMPSWSAFGSLKFKSDEIEAFCTWLKAQKPDDYGAIEVPLKTWQKTSKQGLVYMSISARPKQQQQAPPAPDPFFANNPTPSTAPVTNEQAPF